MPPLTNLRAVRESKALTQGELAQRAGTTQHTISRIEQGTLQQPRLTTVRRLAAALDVAPAELMAPSLGAGIYALRDSDSSAVYVGASSDISARFAAHRVLLRTRRQRSTVLQGAWDNGTLVFEVLERTATTPGALQTGPVVVALAELDARAFARASGHPHARDFACAVSLGWSDAGGGRRLACTARFAWRVLDLPAALEKRFPEGRGGKSRARTSSRLFSGLLRL